MTMQHLLLKTLIERSDLLFEIQGHKIVCFLIKMANHMTWSKFSKSTMESQL